MQVPHPWHWAGSIYAAPPRPAHSRTTLLLDDLWDAEWAGACAGQAADALFRIDLRDHASQVERIALREQRQRAPRRSQRMADGFLR